MEILLLWTCRFVPFTCSNSLQMGWMLWWANSQPWFWAWAARGLVSCLAFPPGHYPDELSSTVASSANTAYFKELQQLSCFGTLRPRSRSLISPGPALLFCPGKLQALCPNCCRGNIGGVIGSVLLLSCPQGWLTCIPTVGYVLPFLMYCSW